MLGPFTTASCLTPIHQMSLAVLSCAACASMCTTTPTTTTTTTRDRGDRYGPMEWAQKHQGDLASYIMHRHLWLNITFTASHVMSAALLSIHTASNDEVCVTVCSCAVFTNKPL